VKGWFVVAKRVTGAERERLTKEFRRAYESGSSIRELVTSSGRSYGFVHRLLQESGVVLRGRGGARPGRRAKKPATAE